MRAPVRARRWAALCAAAAMAWACGPATPEDQLADAQAAMQRGDAVEAELILQRVLAGENLDDGVAIQAHMIRAYNFAMLLGDLDQARGEFRAIVDLAGVDSDNGLVAALNHADSFMMTNGLASFEAEIRALKAQLPPDSPRQLEVDWHRWEVLLAEGASPEIRETFPGLVAAIASNEEMQLAQRRSLVLNMVRTRAGLASVEGDPETAIATMEQFIAMFPGSDPADYMPFEIAAIERGMGRDPQPRIDAAFVRLEERLASAQTSSEQATAAIMIADAHAALGHRAEAHEAYMSAFDRYFDYQFRPDAMLRWAGTLASQGSEDPAIELAQRVALEYPGSQYNMYAEQILGAVRAGAFRASPEATASPEITVPPAAPASPETASPETTGTPVAEVAPPENPEAAAPVAEDVATAEAAVEAAPVTSGEATGETAVETGAASPETTG